MTFVKACHDKVVIYRQMSAIKQSECFRLDKPREMLLFSSVCLRVSSLDSGHDFRGLVQSMRGLGVAEPVPQRNAKTGTS